MSEKGKEAGIAVTAEELAREKPLGIIFTGGPDSVYAPGAPCC